MQRKYLVARHLAWTLLALLFITAHARAGQKPKEWNPVIVPSEFSSTVDNLYFPLNPGQNLSYSNKDGSETFVVEITSRTRTVMGVRTAVVIETASENGQVVEISENWYAQDQDGNVWYFGEFTRDFVDGSPAGTEGSWEAGVDGALPGIIMAARPSTGDSYFQEYAVGVAEDMATVQSIGTSEITPLDGYSGVLKTKEWTPLEPNSVEHKYYAPGVGLIREVKGGKSIELVAIN